MKINKKQLFKMAWEMCHEFRTFGESLRQAWKVLRLRAKMLIGNVSFKFKKVSGEIREAIGTLNFTYESKGTGRPTPSDSMLYFDVESNGIRSCKLVNII